MTANMIKGKGFGGALRYNLEKVDKGVAEILDSSFVDATQTSIMKEMQMVKMLRPNLQKHFYHTSINFPPSENLSSEKMKEIGREYLEESGFTQHQFIMFRHHDAEHPHLHILVSRIGYDGSVLSDSNDFAKCEIILRRLEKKHNLAEVVSSRNAQKRAVTKNELEMEKRTGIPSNKMRMQSIIKDALNSSKKPSCIEFVQRLQSRDINVLFNQASTGYVSGISYSYKGMTITGSKLGTDFKWATIKANINYDQDRDRILIQAINAQMKSGDFSFNSITKLHSKFLKQEYRELKGNFESLSFPSSDENVLSELMRAEKQLDVDPQIAMRLKRKKRKGIRR
ncbi:MAG: relaxase/mobilization nuclease domain-containing protein [Bacteroidota bacterium]